MKTILATLYTLVVFVLCGVIVISLVKWAMGLSVIPIILLIVGTFPFMFLSNWFDKAITFFPYYFIRLRPFDVYCLFFVYFIVFGIATFQLWSFFWQHEGHWILSCIFGTIMYWILLAMKGNDLVLIHKRMGIM